MVKPTVTFYYDVISPFSLFAFDILRRYQSKWGIEIIYKPAFLGGVMAASKNQPPANVVNKGTHMRAFDLPMISNFYGIPTEFPAEFPVNTINTIRFLRIIEDEEPDKLEALSAIFFQGMWGPGNDAAACAKPANFPKYIPTSLLSAEKLQAYLKKAQGNENKDRVKNESALLASTVENNGTGAFGFPWMIVKNSNGEVAKFFGSDRFELMADFLGVKWSGPNPDKVSKL